MNIVRIHRGIYILYKKCNMCHCLLPISCFYKDKRRSDGFRRECKECNRKRINNFHKKHPNYRHNRYLKRYYGI